MLNRQQIFGKKSETEAVKHLKKLGYKIVKQNYKTKIGEIDIIARDKDTLVFVEVKARNSAKFGNPKLAVTSKKQKKISMVALQYLKSIKKSNVKARFDVVAIIKDKDGVYSVEIIKNAFELAYR